MKSATKGLEQTVWHGRSENAGISSSLPLGKPSIRQQTGSRSFSRRKWRKYCRRASPMGNVRPGRSTVLGDTDVLCLSWQWLSGKKTKMAWPAHAAFCIVLHDKVLNCRFLGESLPLHHCHYCPLTVIQLQNQIGRFQSQGFYWR